MQLANKSIEVASLRDEVRWLRAQLKDSTTMLDEGKSNIVELLKETQRKDVEIRKLKSLSVGYNSQESHASREPISRESASNHMPREFPDGRENRPWDAENINSNLERKSSNPARNSSPLSGPLSFHDGHAVERSNALLRSSVLSVTDHAPAAAISHQIGSGDRYAQTFSPGNESGLATSNVQADLHCLCLGPGSF